MVEVSDETLMAYVDGELDEAASARVVEALAADPAMRARADKLRSSRAAVEHAFDPVLREPVPDSLIDFVRRSSPDAMPSGPAVVQFGKPSPNRFATARGMPKLMQMAAGLAALVIAGAGGWMLQSLVEGSRSSTQMAVRHDGASWAIALQTALEGAVSGSETPISGADRAEGVVKVVSTFVGQDQRYCRRYAIELASPNLFDGLACRSTNGAWLVEYQSRRVAARADAQPGLRPAEGSSRKGVDAVVDGMIDGGVMDADEERQLIEGHWSAAPPSSGR